MSKERNFIEAPVHRVSAASEFEMESDSLAVEEPLEIRLGFYENGVFKHKSISITMRTPGDDFDLAVGFLFTEKIIESPNQISQIQHCGVSRNKAAAQNTIRVDLNATATVDLKRLERHFYTSSSCGVCGKTSIEALQIDDFKSCETSKIVFSADVVHRLPEILRRSQNVFERTGGLHAAALFDSAGEIEILREDVGRHNAVDKLVGAKFLKGETPISNRLLLVSGRASFELVQKALMAGIPILAAVGAPSSLAVELAIQYEMTLLGFVRENRFNIYAGAERIVS